MAKYKLNGYGVNDTETGANIPPNILNRHWREYLEWLDEGNVPDPEDVPPPPTKKELLNETREEFIDSLDWVIQYLILQNVIKKTDLPPELDALYEARKAIKDG